MYELWKAYSSNNPGAKSIRTTPTYRTPIPDQELRNAVANKKLYERKDQVFHENQMRGSEERGPKKRGAAQAATNIASQAQKFTPSQDKSTPSVSWAAWTPSQQQVTFQKEDITTPTPTTDHDSESSLAEVSESPARMTVEDTVKEDTTEEDTVEQDTVDEGALEISYKRLTCKMLMVDEKFAKFDLDLLQFYGRVYIDHQPAVWSAPLSLFEGRRVVVDDVQVYDAIWDRFKDSKGACLGHFLDMDAEIKTPLRKLRPLARARGDSMRLRQRSKSRKKKKNDTPEKEAQEKFNYFEPRLDEEWEALGACNQNPLGRFCGYLLDTRLDISPPQH